MGQDEHDQQQPDTCSAEEQMCHFVEDGKGGHRREPVRVENLDPRE